MGFIFFARLGLFSFCIFCISLSFSVHGSAKAKESQGTKGKKVSYVNFEEGQTIKGKGRVSYYSHTSSKDTSQVESISSWKPNWIRKMKRSRAGLR